MRLTRFSDIGLRALIYLARAGERGSPVTVAEIAAQFDLPVNHLVKVVGLLAKSGWVTATRGRNGGLRLGAAAPGLKLGAVLRVLEGESELVDCEGTRCRLAGDCKLRDALKAGMRAFYDAMDTYTLHDITHSSTGEQIVQMHRMYLKQADAVAA